MAVPTKANFRHPTDDPMGPTVVVSGVVWAFRGRVGSRPRGGVCAAARRTGLGPALDAITTPDAWAAIKLTLITAGITVPFNALFGLCAAWAIAKHDFPGKPLLITLIDLPFSVSPVVAGLGLGRNGHQLNLRA